MSPVLVAFSRERRARMRVASNFSGNDIAIRIAVMLPPRFEPADLTDFMTRVEPLDLMILGEVSGRCARGKIGEIGEAVMTYLRYLNA